MLVIGFNVDTIICSLNLQISFVSILNYSEFEMTIWCESGIFQDLDELDNALFGNSVSQKPKSAPLSINNLFGDSSKVSFAHGFFWNLTNLFFQTRTEPRKTISFADQTTTSVPVSFLLDSSF